MCVCVRVCACVCVCVWKGDSEVQGPRVQGPMGLNVER